MFCDKCHENLFLVGDFLKKYFSQSTKKEIQKIKCFLEIEEKIKLNEEKIEKIPYCLECKTLLFPSKKIKFFFDSCPD
mgnify:CR=1 FL=1